MFKLKFLIISLLLLISLVFFQPIEFKKTSLNRLEIGSININLPVIQKYTLANTDNELIVNFYPSISGNTVIYGHRFTNSNPFNSSFRNLDKVKENDEILFYWNNLMYRYKVSQIEILNPDEIWIYSQKSSPNLLLVTCTPLYNPINRLVVFAGLESIENL